MPVLTLITTPSWRDLEDTLADILGLLSSLQETLP